MYCCPEERPGYLPQPHHLPGYGGHVPTIRQRSGGTFGRITSDIIQDPCVAQAPCPILQPPMSRCCPSDPCCRNPVGCDDIGCCDPVYCPPPILHPKRRKPPCEDLPCDPCKAFQDCMNPQPREPSIRVEPATCGTGYSCGPPPSCCGDTGLCCDPRAHHLNRGPYACPCKPEPDNNVYRCCESMSSSYAGHVPGFTFHSTGRTIGKATWGTKQYMNKCFYFNTFTKP